MRALPLAFLELDFFFLAAVAARLLSPWLFSLCRWTDEKKENRRETQHLEEKKCRLLFGVHTRRHKGKKGFGDDGGARKQRKNSRAGIVVHREENIRSFIQQPPRRSGSLLPFSPIWFAARPFVWSPFISARAHARVFYEGSPHSTREEKKGEALKTHGGSDSDIRLINGADERR